MQPLSAWRVLGAAAVVMGGVGGMTGVISGGPARPAAAASVYSGDAEADGLRVTVAVNNFLVFNQLVDAGIPTAAATLTSLGTSQAFASDPYPGSTVIGAGGLVASGGGPTPPAYPLYAASSYPQAPEASAGSGVLTLHAASDASSSTASAVSGADGLGALSAGLMKTTASTVGDAAGAVTSAGESVIDSIDVGGVLTIGKAEARAVAEMAPDGTPTMSKSFVLQGVSVAGIGVSVSDRGISLIGSSTPLPDDSGPAAVLAGAGISLHYIRGYQSATTVVSPGLRIDVAESVPGVGQPVISYYLGEATADASSSGGVPSAAAPSSELGGVNPPTATATPGPAAGSAPGPPVPPAAVSSPGAPGSGSAGSGSGASPAGAPSLSAPGGAGSAATAGPSTPAVTGRQQGGAAGRAILARAQTSWVGFYGILLLAGVAALGGASLIRFLGVRLRWT